MMNRPKGYVSPTGALERSRVADASMSRCVKSTSRRHGRGNGETSLSVRKLAKYANVSATTIQSIRDGEAYEHRHGEAGARPIFVGGNWVPTDKGRAGAEAVCGHGKQPEISAHRRPQNRSDARSAV